MTDEQLREKRREAGRKGGQAKVPKGAAKLSPAERKKFSRLGVEAREKKNGR